MKWKFNMVTLLKVKKAIIIVSVRFVGFLTF